MNSPAAPKPSLGVTAFHDLVDQALRESVGVRETAAHALLLGVVPDEIVAYVRRTLPHHAREEVTAQAARVPWVMGRIVALVKARRNPSSLGARILEGTGEVNPYAWGIEKTEDRDADVAELLDQVA